MSTHLTKKDVRSPDKLTQELKKGFTWTTQHSKLVLLIVVALLIVGAGITGYSMWSDHREAQIQEEYFKFEKDYLDKKQAFQQAALPVNPKAPQNAQPQSVKASGDIEADYGTVVKEFKTIVEQNPKTKAAKMSALNLAEIYSSYGKTDEAIEVLNKVTSGSDMLAALVLTQVGTLQADKQDCKSALASWDKALSNKTAGFLSSSLFLKQGLCHESLGDIAQAEASYTKAKESAKEGATAKSAEKYLRLLRVKQN